MDSGHRTIWGADINIPLHSLSACIYIAIDIISLSLSLSLSLSRCKAKAKKNAHGPPSSLHRISNQISFPICYSLSLSLLLEVYFRMLWRCKLKNFPSHFFSFTVIFRSVNY
ncbi:hypothetical protein Pfo_000912 [Paulownia fortunei]|nr:hypothetical protein Pfo_000912 [Paulownia fortunei]